MKKLLITVAFVSVTYAMDSANFFLNLCNQTDASINGFMAQHIVKNYKKQTEIAINPDIDMKDKGTAFTNYLEEVSVLERCEFLNGVPDLVNFDQSITDHLKAQAKASTEEILKISSESESEENREQAKAFLALLSRG